MRQTIHRALSVASFIWLLGMVGHYDVTMERITLQAFLTMMALIASFAVNAYLGGMMGGEPQRRVRRARHETNRNYQTH